jgi:hypothetical protein
MISISVKKIPKPSKVFSTYWKFAAERQAVFFNRLSNKPYPWTSDPIIAKHKFTNAYRASDRVSQYLIRNVIYSGDDGNEEMFFRIILFKLFNKIETWELFKRKLGQPSYSSYDFDEYDKVLTEALREGKKIYSAAYMMASGRSKFGYARKHRNHLRLIELLMKDQIGNKISQMDSMETVYSTLLGYPTIGKFLAYQFTIDINYSPLTHFDENDFVVPGPGALDGIRKCFSDINNFTEAEIIRYVTDNQEMEFKKLNLNFKNLFGRSLKNIDCQNLFCEVDKYSRVAHPEIKGISGRKKIKQIYKINTQKIKYWYPPKWNINHLITSNSVEIGV